MRVRFGDRSGFGCQTEIVANSDGLSFQLTISSDDDVAAFVRF